ncbi:MAG: hypothetical protein JWL72_4233 [Ilumatobacteraceae bacterium]|nr:hypothetical protein [Ilumatobacteraceae bacterium]
MSALPDHPRSTKRRSAIALLALTAGGLVTADRLSASSPDAGGTYDRVVDASFANFADDLAFSRQQVNGVGVGESCDRSSGQWLTDPSSPQPIIVPVADFTSGSCVVGGWSYRVLPRDLPFEPKRYEQRVVLGPIFDDAGDVIGWQQPPDVLVDHVVLDGP